MRKRDLGILLISALAIFFSLQKEGTFFFKEAWFYLEDDSYPIKHEAERLPPPIVADLNGDGYNEVIIATSEAKILVLEPHSKPAAEGFTEARKVAEVSLLPDKVRVAAGRRPVAMSVGVIQRAYTEGAVKKQVLVVVTAGWVIMCFDHNLKKLWESDVQEHFPHGAHHKEVAISISNYTLHHGDVGLVIVGGSMEVQPQLYLDPFEEAMVAEKEAERHRISSDSKEENNEDDSGGSSVLKSRHFSYYAFAGFSGALRWSHASKDFHREPPSSANLIPQHNYKLDASSLHGRHHGEMECREFRESILEVMPHRWENRDDTSFELKVFQKHKRKIHKKLPGNKRTSFTQQADEHHPPGKDTRNKVSSALSKAARFATGAKPKKKWAHYSMITNHTISLGLPNVVVVHLKEGIEAVHLPTGHTVCKLWLQAGGLHADINGDGVLDHVQAVGGSGAESIVPDGTMEAIKPCWAIASSGVPVREQLFNGSICRHSAFNAFYQGDFSSRAFGRSVDAATVEVVAPIWMPQGHDKHIHGDVVFLTSRGEVTAFSVGSGTSQEAFQRWQIATSAIWTTHHSLGGIGLDKTVPTLKALSLHKAGPAVAILVAGEQEAVILSSEGSQLSSISLPSSPIHPIQVADFSGDGFNDLIVCTSTGIYGFVQTQQPGAIFFSSLVGCLIIVMAVVFIMQHMSSPKGKPRAIDKRSTDL